MSERGSERGRQKARTQAEKAGDARKTRGIRFSESEWDEVKNAQLLTDEMPAGGIRPREDTGARTRAGGRATHRRRAPSLAPLIERMFRYTWFLATEKRDAMMREGRAEELDALVEEAQAFQDSLRTGRRRLSRASAGWAPVPGWVPPIRRPV